MLDLAAIESDLSEIIADLPVTCEFRGQSFSATSTDSGGSRSIEIDGDVVSVDRSIVCMASDIPANARADERITVDGTEYRISVPMRHQDGKAVEIALKQVYR